jgi:hypothetical protein
MNIALFGTFYKGLKNAFTEADRKNRIIGRKIFVVLQFSNGYLVISKRILRSKNEKG